MSKYKCGIDENGHSYEIWKKEMDWESDHTHPVFSDLKSEDQELVKRWVKKVCQPAVAINKRHTSYGLKHILESCVGVYMTNNQFKDLMLICGFKPKYEHELNWQFFIKERPFIKIRKWQFPDQGQWRIFDYGSFKPECLDEFFALEL